MKGLKLIMGSQGQNEAIKNCIWRGKYTFKIQHSTHKVTVIATTILTHCVSVCRRLEGQEKDNGTAINMAWSFIIQWNINVLDSLASVRTWNLAHILHTKKTYFWKKFYPKV